MRIDKIKIKNFKGFEDVKFTLNPHFTVFIGDNAKGKTTVLDALAIGMGSFFRGIDVAQKEIKTIRKNDIRIETFNNDPKPQLPSTITAIGSVLGINDLTWFRTVERFTPKLTSIGANNVQQIAEAALSRSRAGEKVIFPLLSYYRTGRLFISDESIKVPYEKKGEGVAMGYNQCLTAKSSGTNFLSWYKTYEDEVLKFKNESDMILLTAFKNAIVSMIPDKEWTQMAYSFKDDDLVGLFSTTKGNFNKLLFGQLSDGYRNIIGLAADIAFRCIKLNPHLGIDAILKSPGIVLIDEIDLHLHPNWQKRIVEDFKNTFPSIQFIVSTHSPFIVQSLKDEELVNLDKKGGLDEDPNKYSIEEISEKEMLVKHVERSRTFLEMQNQAKNFFKLIKDKSNPHNIQEAKSKLDYLRMIYNHDPAYVALLEAELPPE